MAIFNSYVKLPEGSWCFLQNCQVFSGYLSFWVMLYWMCHGIQGLLVIQWDLMQPLGKIHQICYTHIFAYTMGYDGYTCNVWSWGIQSAYCTWRYVSVFPGRPSWLDTFWHRFLGYYRGEIFKNYLRGVIIYNSFLKNANSVGLIRTKYSMDHESLHIFLGEMDVSTHLWSPWVIHQFGHHGKPWRDGGLWTSRSDAERNISWVQNRWYKTY